MIKVTIEKDEQVIHEDTKDTAIVITIDEKGRNKESDVYCAGKHGWMDALEVTCRAVAEIAAEQCDDNTTYTLVMNAAKEAVDKYEEKFAKEKFPEHEKAVTKVALMSLIDRRNAYLQMVEETGIDLSNALEEIDKQITQLRRELAEE